MGREAISHFFHFLKLNFDDNLRQFASIFNISFSIFVPFIQFWNNGACITCLGFGLQIEKSTSASLFDVVFGYKYRKYVKLRQNV